MIDFYYKFHKHIQWSHTQADFLQKRYVDRGTYTGFPNSQPDPSENFAV